MRALTLLGPILFGVVSHVNTQVKGYVSANLLRPGSVSRYCRYMHLSTMREAARRGARCS